MRWTVVDRVVDAASGLFGVRLELPNRDYRLPAGIGRRPQPPGRSRGARRFLALSDPHHIKMIQAGGIASHDLGIVILGHSGQDLRQNLSGLWERGLAMGIIGAPHEVVHANNVPQADADLILLEAQENIAMEKVTGTPAILEPV